MIRGEAGLYMKATRGSFSAQLGSSSPIGVSRQITTLGQRKQAIPHNNFFRKNKICIHHILPLTALLIQ
jgi:hypothetical protein